MSKTLSVAAPLTPHTHSIETEPWVDLRKLAEHIGFGYQATRRMVEDRKIPGKAFQNGKKTFWRFQLSAVDAALTPASRGTVPARERGN
jgi:hypothetical protein